MNQEESQMAGAGSPLASATLSTAQFLLWAKKYGFQTAVLILLAQATGLLGQVTSQIGGMC